MTIPAAVQATPLRALASPTGLATGPAASALSVVIVGWRTGVSPVGRRRGGTDANSSGRAEREPTRCAKTHMNSAPSKKIWAE